jgi:hypothetical protein
VGSVPHLRRRARRGERRRPSAHAVANQPSVTTKRWPRPRRSRARCR